MKIAIVTPFYRPSIGGMQESLGVFADYLVSQGCTVRIYTSQRQRLDELPIVSFRRLQNFPGHSVEAGTEVRRFAAGGLLDGLLGFAYAVCFKLYRPAAGFFYNIYQGRLMRVHRLAREVADFKPDAILTGPCVEYLMRLCVRLCGKTGARLIVQSALHLSEEESGGLRRAVQYLTHAHMVLANTDAEKEYLAANGVDAAKIDMPGIGLNLEAWARVREEEADKRVVERLSGREYILYFGRKQAEKGIEELIEAFHILRVVRPQTVLVLAGEETEYFNKNVAPALMGDDRVVCLGRQDESTKRWLYSHARVFSMVSQVDSYGIVYCESWYSGRPVIGADNRQTSGVIRDGQDGFLVPAQDPQALAHKLKILLEDSVLADSMGQNGYRRLMKEFGGQAVEKKLFKRLQG